MFRLRETLLFKNVPLQVLVSSTRNATFKKQVACRLRKTLVFFENCALVYAKHYFFASRRMGLSRQAPCASWKAAPRRPGPVTGQSCQFFSVPSAAKWHEKSGPKFWPGLAGSLNVRARPEHVAAKKKLRPRSRPVCRPMPFCGTFAGKVLGPLAAFP